MIQTVITTDPLSTQIINSAFIVQIYDISILEHPFKVTVFAQLFSTDGTTKTLISSHTQTIPKNVKRGFIMYFPTARMRAVDNDFVQVTVTLPMNKIEGDSAHFRFSPPLKELEIIAVTEPSTNSRFIGQCIYCGTTVSPLTEEHIIPLGLNGELTLKQASCKSCNKITSRLENEVLRKSWIAPRSGLQLKTRHPKKRPTSLPLYVKDAKGDRTIQIPLSEYPTYLFMPVLAAPELEDHKTNGVKVKAVQATHVAGPSFEELAQKYHFMDVRVRSEFDPNSFARMIAKIAYSYAIFRLGFQMIKQSYVTPIILGEEKNVQRLVGCIDGPPIPSELGLHAISVEQVNKDVYVHVRLFSQFDGVIYTVVVGRLGDPKVQDKKNNLTPRLLRPVIAFFSWIGQLFIKKKKE